MNRSVWLVLMLAAGSGNAFGDPITWSFTGVGDASSPVDAGAIVSGSLTFDPTFTTDPVVTDFSTYAYGSASLNAPYPSPNPMSLSGSVVAPSETFTVGGGSLLDATQTGVIKNSGGENSYFVYGASYQTTTTGSTCALCNDSVSIELATTDYNGASSNMFSTPSSDLSFDQPVNWFAAGATTQAYLYDSVTGISEIVDLTSVTATSVPEPATLGLMVFGLAGLSFARNRRR